MKEQKADREKTSSEKDSKERPPDLNAPISRTEAARRRTKRKREAAEPQKGVGPQAGGHGTSRTKIHAPDLKKFDFAQCVCQPPFRRNVLGRVPSDYRDQMHQVLDQVSEAGSQEEARTRLDDLRERLEEKPLPRP